MKLLAILASLIVVPAVLGAKIRTRTRHETNAERMKRGLPPRAPRFPSRTAGARRQGASPVPPGANALFTNGGFEDAVETPPGSGIFTSPGWTSTNIQSGAGLARSGSFYDLISQAGSQSFSRALTGVNTAVTYNFQLYVALKKTDTTVPDTCTITITLDGVSVASGTVTASIADTQTAYIPVTGTITPTASTGNLLISGTCGSWTGASTTTLQVDDISLE